jgi:hypothetical protein
MMTKIINGYAIISQYTKNRMSPRPEYYSGRGAVRSDLNSDLLELIYAGVKQEAGDEAAANFVQFVCDFDKLAATTFLNEFYAFCNCGCVYVPRKHSAIDELDPGPDNGSRDVVGFGMMMSAMSGMMDRDETESIRNAFLAQHRGEFKPRPGRMSKHGFVCSNGDYFDGFGNCY